MSDDDNLNLLDVLYGEHDAEPEALARLGPEDQRALEGLELTRRMLDELPSLEPPRELDAAILAAARSKSGTESEGALAAEPHQSEEEGLWATILRWVGGVAMGPQVAMATIMLAVVGLGLWYFPKESQDPMVGTTVLSPDDGLSQGPVEPAAPLDLDLDPRTNRLRAIEEEEAFEAPAGDPEASRELAGRADNDRRVTAGAVVDGELAPEVADRPEANAPRQARTQEMAPLPALPAVAREETERDEALTPVDAYARGVRRYNRGSFDAAAEDFQFALRAAPGQGVQVSEALHHLANSHRRAGACRQAIGQYERLLAQFPNYGRAPQAMMDLAACYRQTGRISDAVSLLRRAERYQSVAQAARRELLRLESVQRVRERRRSPSPAPSPPAQFDESAAGFKAEE
ncbi:MAG: tetratricopeptide repeat protein [Myxococcota bacterium]